MCVRVSVYVCAHACACMCVGVSVCACMCVCVCTHARVQVSGHQDGQPAHPGGGRRSRPRRKGSCDPLNLGVTDCPCPINSPTPPGASLCPWGPPGIFLGRVTPSVGSGLVSDLHVLRALRAGPLQGLCWELSWGWHQGRTPGRQADSTDEAPINVWPHSLPSGRIQEDGQEHPGQSHRPLPRGLQPRAEAAARSAEDAHLLPRQHHPGAQEAAECHAEEKANSYGLLLGQS